ncbi:60S ribosomal protein L35a-4 [Iris pallida]|uniref:60S ribosomal protein L35a-4 n=1 Tax=Iris pallida TaxID=29817 RepID=A0AAX6H615_IRIPA|nr:60S ribosomal protein L35a-4 [Iris pallida]
MKEDVAWYAGKKVAYVYKAKVKKDGSHYRCIWGKVTRPTGTVGSSGPSSGPTSRPSPWEPKSGFSCTQATFN